MRILLPRAHGSLEEYRLSGREPLRAPAGPPPQSRTGFAAVHVVIDPLLSVDPALQPVIDFDATLAYRRHLWSLGLHVAEAMDTAQRGMGLGWALARTLIERSCAEASAVGGGIACGANTDQMTPGGEPSLDDVIRAYEEQCEVIEAAGGQVILMASRVLARTAKSPDDYRAVYGRLLSQLKRPAILHWLGEAFDPALRGYWGGRDVAQCMEVCLDIIRENQRAVDGVKISLLDDAREVEMRRLLPAGVRMYTGDDFHYPDLIAGDEQGHSDALLGIFDAIAPAAALAFRALDSGDKAGFHRILDPTVGLSRTLFEAPTFHYKTGIVFLAFLNGHQTHFRMLGGQESARSAPHLASLFMQADQAGLLSNPELAVSRMSAILSLAGIQATPRVFAAPREARPAVPERLSMNQMTIDRFSLRQAVEGCVRHGISSIGVWRHKLNGDAGAAGRMIREAGLRVSSLCRGGMFPAATAGERRRRIEENRRAVDEAAALGTDVLVLVNGPAPTRDIGDARKMVVDGIAEVAAYAGPLGVKLGVEPLHPMFAADRSVIVTLEHANDIAGLFDPSRVGVVIDVYHVWWDPAVYAQIERARGRILGFHISDWIVPTPSLLAGRGMMGTGVIEIAKLRSAVERAGYDGPVEVEIFNDEIWTMGLDDVFSLTAKTYRECS
ncbi:MAG TPA: DUF993 family protein [Bryobacteraceae bacterium]|jgi:sugar phosphate isomerase/epimerase|nr:DUF993 family protein [Bryobacteraceae bacterium]